MNGARLVTGSRARSGDASRVVCDPEWCRVRCCRGQHRASRCEVCGSAQRYPSRIRAFRCDVRRRRRAGTSKWPASTTGDRPSIPTGAALPYRRAAGYRTAAETPSGQDERQPARLAGRWPSRLCRGSGGPTERSCAQKSYKLTLAGHTVRLVDGWAGTRRPRSRTMLSQSHHLARTSASAAARCIARPSRGRRLVRLGVPGQPTARHQVAQKGRDPVRSGAPSTWGIQSHSAQGPTNCDRQVFPKVQPTATARKDEPSEQRDLVRPRPGGMG